MEERTRLQKTVIIVLAAMIALFGALNIVSALNKGVVFEGALLRVTEGAEQTVYSGRAHGEDVEITVTPSDGNLTEVAYVIGNRIRDVCTLETGLPAIRTEHGTTVEGLRVTKNGGTIFEGGYDSEQEYGWYNMDGQWDPMISVRVSYSGGGHWDSYETSFNSVIRFAEGPELARRGSTGLYLMMVLFTLLVLFDVTHPTALFYLNHACDVRDPEPSDFYIATQKASWVICPVLLLFGYIWALWQLP